MIAKKSLYLHVSMLGHSSFRASKILKFIKSRFAKSDINNLNLFVDCCIKNSHRIEMNTKGASTNSSPPSVCLPIHMWGTDSFPRI